MIKQLINDIAFDNIELSKALTRAKIISSKVKNDIFRQWLNKELEGYSFRDALLPEYRKIRCVLYLTVALPFGRKQTFPVAFSDAESSEFLDLVHFHRVVEPISIIEQHIEQLQTPQGQIQLTPEQVELLGRPFQEQIEGYNGALRSGYKEIGKSQFTNIIELTKQKLLDTLLELDNEFPNLINDFSMTKENNEKVQNIITNNIYGDNNPLNIAAGQDVEQKDIYTTITANQISELEKLGVEHNEIEELKQIVSTNKNNKSSLKEKAMKWLGSVSASIAAKGLYDKIPAITDFVHRLTQ